MIIGGKRNGKKKYSGLKIVLIVLLMVVIGVSSYFLGQKNLFNNKETEKTEIKENENNKKEEKQEEIKLTEEELKEYLNYIPQGDILSYGAYGNKKSSVDTFDKNKLLGSALLYSYSEGISKNLYSTKYFDTKKYFKFYGEEGFETEYITKDNLNSFLKKMYNITISDININDGTKIDAFGLIFCYQDKEFYLCGSGGGTTAIHVIENYQVNDQTLIIEEVNAWMVSNGAGIFDINNRDKYYYFDENGYEDYRKQNGTTINGNATYEFDFEKYIKDNKDKFTKYKHTFLKNDTGYYWYSTEVIKNS